MAVNILSAYLLDILFGDPSWMPHPVRIIGFFILRLEDSLRNRAFNLKIAGVLLTITVVGLTYIAVFGLISAGYRINPGLGKSLEIFFIYASIAIKDLKAHMMRIYRHLEDKDIIQARKAVSMVAGRDTLNLSETQIIRVSVESVGENFVDGILSPLFYCFLGGPALAMAYKAINTLDSMVGHKNQRYEKFGWASAKLDDLANYIPARISIIFLSLGSWLCRRDGYSALRIGLRDGRKSPSPNSGLPEAALAGALGIQLGGLNYYNSTAVEKPLIGDNNVILNIEHIKASLGIVYWSSLLALLCGIMIISMA